ncbi:winged helix-turn-helix transcriptional regulator [Candidatus Uhrbacteria bacterium]|nr:winged helix-turn-helix transcriptional regulator [Candidatus Uhrbacteria bacterium]
MKKIEKTLKALANHRRLAILKYIKSHKEAPVSEAAEAIRLSFKATSKHLRILAGADILEKEQRSLQMFYSLAPNLKPEAKQIINLL